MPIDPEVARERARIAGNTYWANVTDRTAATAKMRQGFVDKKLREARERLGPGATDDQVTKSAQNAIQAHYATMRKNSLLNRQAAKAERQRAQLDAVIDAAQAELAQAEGAA